MIRLAPSILAADFRRLEAHCREAIDAGVECLHVDVMDGHFVPNISMGPLVVRALRPLADETGVVIDVHLMISEPDRYIGEFAEAGADILTVHTEVLHHLHRTVHAIKDLGCKAGVSVNPATPLHAVEEILADVDLVLIMTVDPGFGGQQHIHGSEHKIRRMRARMDAIDSKAWLQVDGGITPANAADVVAAGADVLVAGSAIFRGPRSVAENVAAFREAIGTVSP
jgi:ribulose-phosphate 3-epimerase